MLLSFVIIAYNEAQRITQSILSIQDLEGLSSYEIIVVDDGSDDATCQVVQNLANDDCRISVVSFGINRGRGAARFAGVNASAGRYIAMVDADIILPRDWWSKCQEAILDYDAVSGIAVPDGDVVYLSDRFHLEPKATPATTTVTGNNAVFRREVFDRVQYEEDRRNGEDVALSHAIENCGLTSFVISGLLVRHREDKTLFQTMSWLFESGIGAARQFEMYREMRRPDQATAFLVVLMVNVFVPRREGRKVRLIILGVAIVGVAAAHVRTRFVFSRKGWLRYVVGVFTDALLISMYVSGRIVGHGYVCRRSER